MREKRSALDLLERLESDLLTEDDEVALVEVLLSDIEPVRAREHLRLLLSRTRSGWTLDMLCLHPDPHALLDHDLLQVLWSHPMMTPATWMGLVVSASIGRDTLRLTDYLFVTPWPDAGPYIHQLVQAWGGGQLRDLQRFLPLALMLQGDQQEILLSLMREKRLGMDRARTMHHYWEMAGLLGTGI